MPILRLISRARNRRRQSSGQISRSEYGQICQTTPDPSENNNVEEETPKQPQTTIDPKTLYQVTLTRKATRRDDDNNNHHSLGIKLRVMGGKVILLHVQALEDGTPSPAQDCGLLERGDLMVSINGISLLNCSSHRELNQRVKYLLIEPNEYGVFEKSVTLEMASGVCLDVLEQVQAMEAQRWDQVMTSGGDALMEEEGTTADCAAKQTGESTNNNNLQDQKAENSNDSSPQTDNNNNSTEPPTTPEQANNGDESTVNPTSKEDSTKNTHDDERTTEIVSSNNSAKVDADPVEPPTTGQQTSQEDKSTAPQSSTTADHPMNGTHDDETTTEKTNGSQKVDAHATNHSEPANKRVDTTPATSNTNDETTTDKSSDNSQKIDDDPTETPP
ncbi:expressed unknown protein [Seminavis robusta]|uniref:PDZ domain-containing protein n=1 Tax=Seminavis robusta TaxID=568900 RepID=A0A9N8E6F6_9STRA|nr:expressed unknown protein [Seminavis robusta]|eukprot:Sro722_g192870.1 n/a (388) ;mRNA; f:23281-24444